jgi:hypothetical protein
MAEPMRDEMQISPCDVLLYASFMSEEFKAQERGLSLYEVRRQEFARQRALAHADGRPFEFAAQQFLEYPPLAFAFMRLATLGIGVDENFTQEYRRRYAYMLVAADLMLFVLLICAHNRLAADRGWAAEIVPLGSYLLFTALLYPLMYNNLDLVLALLMFASLLLLQMRAHWLWSFLILALAINYKVIPLILLPVWVLGSLPRDAAASLFRPRVLQEMLVRCVALLALVIAIFLPFYILWGPASLGFFAYHAERGLEIESVDSSVLLLLSFFGHPIETYYSHGSFNLRSPMSSYFVSMAPFLVAGLLTAALWLLCRRLSRIRRDTSAPAHATLAQEHPSVFAYFTLLFLLLFVCANKVLSPQYFLWLAPFACFVPWQGRCRAYFCAAFAATCLLTTVLYPFQLLELVAVTGPTTYGILLLCTRTALLVGTTAGLFCALSRPDN